MKWLKDPVSKQPSVALTLLVVASVCMVSGIVLEAFTNLRSTHLLDELFGAAVAMYTGHIYAFRNQRDDSESNITPQ